MRTKRLRLIGLVLISLALAPLALHGAQHEDISDSRIKQEFWKQQKKGANFFNEIETEARLQAAAELGLQFIRLTPSKWQGVGRDFLIGDVGAYQGLLQADLQRLITVLDQAHRVKLKVVLTFLSLPGCRWRQHNDGQSDSRLWRDFTYQSQAIRFWKDLAQELKHHPSIVAYDILNEPHPRIALVGKDDVGSPAYRQWLESVRGTEADLNRFYGDVVTAVRSVDKVTPLILEAGAFAAAAAMKDLKPLDDPAVLYSFHFYEPWNYTTFRVNRKQFAYPDRMPNGWSVEQGTQAWTAQYWQERLQVIWEWQQTNKVGSDRILVGEFGCDRRVSGARAYLSDLIRIWNDRDWHWAFYAYREDGWMGMDYELGTGPVGAAYWEALEAGKNPTRPWTSNDLFDVLRREFNGASKPSLKSR